MKNSRQKGKLSASFVTGAIALVFLAVGYQTALFIHRAAAMKILSGKAVPDTVYVADWQPASENVNSSGGNRFVVERKHGGGPREVSEVVSALSPRKYESFRFNPNTADIEDLCRLGFTLEQARSIEHYRMKGGRFRRKSDFARSYVVSDSLYRRLEPYIDIPLLDINSADSAAFDALPGIGGYFASKMVEYRNRLGGYSFKEQLMDIYHLDAERYAVFQDLVEVGSRPKPFGLWNLPPDSLRLHPYIRNWQTAKAIVLYRDNNPRTLWTISGLQNAGILDSLSASRLGRCIISSPVP